MEIYKRIQLFWDENTDNSVYLTSSLYSEILIFVVCYILRVFWVKYFWYLTYPTPSVWCVFCLLRRLLLTSSLYSEILLLISLWSYILSVFWNITTYISKILHPLCILKYYYSYLCVVRIILSLCILKYYYWFLCDYTFSMNSEILLLISLRIIQHSLYSEIFLLISLWSYILSMFWNITTSISLWSFILCIFWNITTDISVIIYPLCTNLSPGQSEFW